MAAPEPLFFASAAEFRAWLARHGGRETVLAVGFHKVGSGTPSMTWPQSVDEALCFGWIDGVRKRIDDAAYEARIESESRVDSRGREDEPPFTAEEWRELRRNQPAWVCHSTLPPGCRRTMTHWVVSGKQAATRDRRLQRFIEACAAGQRLLP